MHHRYLATAIIMASLPGLPVAAMAEDRNGLYVAGMIGLGGLTDADFSGNFIPTLPARGINPEHDIPDEAVLNFDYGVFGSGAVGYQYRSWRFEAEGSWRNNDLKSTQIHNPDHNPDLDPGHENYEPPFEDMTIEGTSISTVSGMANAWYSFDLDEAVRPFIGAGIGVANLTAEAPELGKASHTGLAWQAGGGFEFEALENTTVTLSLRYFRAMKPQFEWSSDAGPRTLETEYHSFDVGIGLRYRFF